MVVLNSYFYNAVGIGIAFFLAVVTYFKWSYTYWQSKGVPTAIKPVMPYGSMKDTFMLKKHFGVVFQETYDMAKAKSYKHTGAYFIARPLYLAIDPDLIKNIMIKDSYNFVDRRTYYNEQDDPLSAHLFSLKGDKWKNLRQKVTRTFTTQQLRYMFSALVECSKNLEEYLEQHVNELLDSKEILSRFTTDIVASCAYGIECNSLQTPNSDFRKYGKLFFERSPLGALRMFIAATLPFNLLRLIGFKLIRTDVSNFFKKTVEK